MILARTFTASLFMIVCLFIYCSFVTIYFNDVLRILLNLTSVRHNNFISNTIVMALYSRVEEYTVPACQYPVRPVGKSVNGALQLKYLLIVRFET